MCSHGAELSLLVPSAQEARTSFGSAIRGGGALHLRLAYRRRQAARRWCLALAAGLERENIAG